MAAASIFLSIPGVKGPSLDSKHPDTIECLSFTWGAANAGSSGVGTGAGSGTSVAHDLTITKLVDTASNVLMQSCGNGKHFDTATLFVTKTTGGDPMDYMQFDMGSGSAPTKGKAAVFISSYHVSGSGDGITPIETVGINFASLMITYTPQSADGTAGAPAALGHDFHANKSF